MRGCVSCVAALLAALAASACRDDIPDRAAAASPASTAFYATAFERRPGVAEMTVLGRRLFHDVSLSASRRSSCASCHDPAHAYRPPNARAVQLAGIDGGTPGLRTAPSLRYLHKVPPFTEHFFDADGNDANDQGPAGGHMWDGRARSLHEQAALPLLSPLEMANRDRAEVVERVRRSDSAPALRAAFGPRVLDDVDTALRAVTLCLEVFQQDPAEFYPYSSKYDSYLRGEATLTPREQRGLALFNDPAKGNCAACHPSGMKEGALPAFSDWGFVALGVPRNRALAANADPARYDLGLCGPIRSDLAAHEEYCGMFRTPSLRNVARREVFFHNGRVASLEDAVRFYAERDTRPALWYPRGADGRVVPYDDLPPRLRANVNREPPFGGKPGDKPRLDRGEIRDIVAFLRTLDDGYAPAPRTAQNGGMHPHEERIREFYAAFARLDAEAMARCYHADVFFSDPVFPSLHGAEAADMWRMLLSRAADLEVTLDSATGDAAGAQAQWTARYTFSRSGRRVVNVIRATFAFRDGLIVRHYDSFPFWRWASQALGPAGAMLGWFPPLKWKVRKDAAKSLEHFRGSRAKTGEPRMNADERG